MNLYNFLEQFIYINLIKTLNYKYKGEISQEKQKEIETKLEEYIDIKKDLTGAVRRFIIRYLSENDDINENEDLTDELFREDLWDEEILKKGNLNSEIGDKLREFKLKVGQAYEFYELINQEDKKIIKEYEKIRSELKKEKIIKEKKEGENIHKEEDIKKKEKKEEKRVFEPEERKDSEEVENEEENEKEKKKEKEDKNPEKEKKECNEKKEDKKIENDKSHLEEKKINIEGNRKIIIKEILNNKNEIREENKEPIIQEYEQERDIKIKEEKQKIKPIKLQGKKEEIEMEKIKLLFNLIIQECHYLKEIIPENDNSLISINELLDMEKCGEFFIDLGNLDDLKFKENLSKSEYENILIQFNKFIIKFGSIKALKSSLFESFIKKAKEFTENGFSILLKNQSNEEKENNNKVNNFINNMNEILSFDKNDPSSKFLFEEEKELFNKMSNYIQNINNNLKNNEIILEKKNEELNEIINKLKLDLEKEKEINNNLNINIKKLEIEIKDKEKEINEEKLRNNDLNKKIKNINNSSQNSDILDLVKKIGEKENEIKELKEILPFEYTKGEKILIVTFLSLNEDIHYSIICKNTDDFYRLEIMFYNKYPEYKKGNNIFSIHGKEIDRYNDLESNNISDNDIKLVKHEIKNK